MTVPEITLFDLASKGAAELGKALIDAYIKRRVDQDPAKTTRLKSNITPHIESTYNRCSVIKTLLNPQTPANFLAIHAAQRFHVSGEEVDHYGMVDYIKTGPQNLILTGTGGSGKSMFTRYLWISLFVYNDGKIPLFIELRSINNLSMDNFLAYMNYSIAQGSAALTDSDFQTHLKNGDFIVILDGFDEVLQSKRESIQKQIISMTENYPKLKVVLTSRPDNNFASWPSFEVAVVAPLKKEDVIELIQKAEFTEDSKTLFLKRLKETDLFRKHQSFLTNPLLASMMLLTFSHNFDIPDRMHLFYQQAFDALFQRHDSYKPGGFKRQFKTALSEDVFKRIISYFCLKTYHDEKFTFTREEAISALNNGIKLAGAQAESTDMLDDLISCVCFLILDGLQYDFSHRSFQEYFTACCMSYLEPNQFAKLVSKFSSRVNDQVIPLLADMNPDVLRREYILPAAKQFETELQLASDQKSVTLFLQHTNMTCDIQFISQAYTEAKKRPRVNRGLPHVFVHGRGEFFNFVSLLDRLQKRTVTPIVINRVQESKNQKSIAAIVDAFKLPKGALLSIKAAEGKMRYIIEKKSRQPSGKIETSKEVILDRPDVDHLVSVSFLHEFLSNFMNDTADYVLEQRSLEASVSTAMTDLFGS